MSAFTLTIPGKPVPWQRPRFNRATGGVFTDARARGYAERVQTEWIAAGRPSLEAGAYGLAIVHMVARPKGHFRKGGGFSAAGMAAGWYPTSRPDVDNVAKLIIDALMGVGAIPDDAALAYLRAGKQYQTMSHDPHKVIVAAASITLDHHPDLLSLVGREAA